MKTQSWAQGPSGRWYQLWANGNGITVRSDDFTRVQHEAGSEVECIVLADVPTIAALIAQSETQLSVQAAKE